MCQFTALLVQFESPRGKAQILPSLASMTTLPGQSHAIAIFHLIYLLPFQLQANGSGSEKYEVGQAGRSPNSLMSYRCHLCPFFCTDMAAADEHLKIVHNTKRFWCVICRANFGAASSLKRHEQSIHYCRYLYNCNFCQVGYNHKERFLNHLKSQHGVTDHINAAPHEEL